MDFSKVIVGDRFEYIGDSFAFGGCYITISAESTYSNQTDCPDHEKGKLMIVEFMNNGTPMYFTLDHLNPEDWKLMV